MQLLGLIDCAVLLLSLATMVLVLFVAMARYFLIVGYVWYASVKTDNYTDKLRGKPFKKIRLALLIFCSPRFVFGWFMPGRLKGFKYTVDLTSFIPKIIWK